MVPPVPLIRRSEPWTARAAGCVHQEPLIDTRVSMASLRHADPARPPRAVYLGVGLCTRDHISCGVPVDLLGVLLPAEAIRRAAQARDLVVVIADRHAASNGFCPTRIEERAQAVEAVLERTRRRCRLERLVVLRATTFHQHPRYRSALAQVRGRLGPGVHDYVVRQLADALYLDRHYGALLKVGWVLRGASAAARRDEVAFDRGLPAVGGERIDTIYCKPGRSLADEAPRMPPYLVRRPEARIFLDRHDDPASKLARAHDRARGDRAARHTVDGFRRHLRAVLYTYGRMIEPLPRGPLERRMDALLGRLGPAGGGGERVARRVAGQRRAASSAK